jgi:benzoyl-CoA reductase subunit B
MEAAERYGFGRELCGYSKNVWGAMMLNQFIMPDGTILDEWPVPDVAVSWAGHNCHCKWIQFMSEYKDIPCSLLDSPKVYPRIDEALLNYLTVQVLDCIDFVETTTKRKFDDELLIEGVYNEFRAFRLWTEIMLLNQNIPAPLEEKTIYSLMVPNLMRPFSKETVDFNQRLLEEVQDRVDRGIAAVGNERFRIMTDAIPPWPYLSLWRYLEREWGVVSVGSPYVIPLVGSWEFDDQGNFVPVLTPEELGWKITTREEAVRAEVWYRSHFATETIYFQSGGRIEQKVATDIARQWKVDAAILHVNRGCILQALGGVENRRALMEAGIPAMNYEGNDGDPRDLNMPLTKRHIDIFLESLGIEKLSNSEG